jgi:uncharacterized protein (TIGR02271 family)
VIQEEKVFNQKNAIREGMQVYDTNNQLIGTVERVERNDIWIAGQRISSTMISQVNRDGVWITEAGASAFNQSQGEARIPIVEERLNVGKRTVQEGEVQIHKTVTEEQQSVPVELRREEVHIEHRDIPELPLRPGEAEAAQAFQESTLRIPVRAEEAVANKEAVVTGEVVVNKTQNTERRDVTDTVRKERVEVDQPDQHRTGYQDQTS